MFYSIFTYQPDLSSGPSSDSWGRGSEARASLLDTVTRPAPAVRGALCTGRTRHGWRKPAAV